MKTTIKLLSIAMIALFALCTSVELEEEVNESATESSPNGFYDEDGFFHCGFDDGKD